MNVGRIKQGGADPGSAAGAFVAKLRAWALAELLSFAIVAAAATWPLVRHVDTHLPLGTEPAATVPLFTAWTVWWNADRAAQGYRDYWDAPIFAPTSGAFAFSEPMPSTAVVAPLVWLAGNPILAHNCFLLAALTLNGWTTFQLLRSLRMRWLVCLLGGGSVEMLPLVHSELGVLQMVPLCGTVWTIHALYLFGQRPGLRRALMLAAAFAATYLTCAYYGLFLSLLLLPAAPWLLATHLRRVRTWYLLAGSAGVTLLLVAPVIAAQMRVIRTHDLRRDPDWVTRLAAAPRDYAVTPWPPLFEPDFAAARRAQSYFRLNPGWWKIGLAALGIGAGLWWRRHRRWTAFCLTLLGAAFVLSLGPRLAWGGWSPYVLLMEWYPGMAQARNAYRFAVFFQLAVALLAAVGLQFVCGQVCGSRRHSRSLISPRSGLPSLFTWLRRSRSSRLRWAFVAGIGLLAAAEVHPPAQNLFAVPLGDAQRGWIAWLQTQTPADSVIACIPFPQGSGVKDYEQTALWMLWGTRHQRRMVNGYSGFFPKSFLETKAALQKFPDAASVQRLRDIGATYCVVRRAARATEMAEAPEFELVFEDEQTWVDVYRLRP